MKRSSALFALSLILIITPAIAVAGDRFFVAPVSSETAYAAEYGAIGRYIHPFDDGYDYPFGYGEYAGSAANFRYVISAIEVAFYAVAMFVKRPVGVLGKARRQI